VYCIVLETLGQASQGHLLRIVGQVRRLLRAWYETKGVTALTAVGEGTLSRGQPPVGIEDNLRMPNDWRNADDSIECTGRQLNYLNVSEMVQQKRNVALFQQIAGCRMLFDAKLHAYYY
jgi:hypothetical protein